MERNFKTYKQNQSNKKNYEIKRKEQRGGH